MPINVSYLCSLACLPSPILTPLFLSLSLVCSYSVICVCSVLSAVVMVGLSISVAVLCVIAVVYLIAHETKNVREGNNMCRWLK